MSAKAVDRGARCWAFPLLGFHRPAWRNKTAMCGIYFIRQTMTYRRNMDGFSCAIIKAQPMVKPYYHEFYNCRVWNEFVWRTAVRAQICIAR